jgi:ElaB/YqjD/DUF883 family membrane-anchored ribosome-binding protein
MHEEKNGHHAHSATDDLRDKASEVAQDVRDMGGQLGDVAREQYENVKEQASQYYKRGRKRAADVEEGFEDYIREKPIHAILVAAGIGLLVGMMWRRR